MKAFRALMGFGFTAAVLFSVLFSFAACTTVEQRPARTTSTTTTEEQSVSRPLAGPLEGTTETRTTTVY